MEEQKDTKNIWIVMTITFFTVSISCLFLKAVYSRACESRRVRMKVWKLKNKIP